VGLRLVLDKSIKMPSLRRLGFRAHFVVFCLKKYLRNTLKKKNKKWVELPKVDQLA
jgi:hypothetical protein